MKATIVAKGTRLINSSKYIQGSANSGWELLLPQGSPSYHGCDEKRDVADKNNTR